MTVIDNLIQTISNRNEMHKALSKRNPWSDTMICNSIAYEYCPFHCKIKQNQIIKILKDNSK